jgi:hypothetical protein
VIDINKAIEIIELNVTELCNRKCSFCPRHNSDVYANRNLHMGLDVFDQIAKRIIQCRYKGHVVISGFSEPLLAQNLLAGIEILKKTGVYVKVITNGDKLGVDSLKALIKTGIDHLKVDVYDNAREYEHICGIVNQQSTLRGATVEVFPAYKGVQNFNNRAGSSTVDSGVVDFKNRQCFIPFYKLMIDYDGSYILCHNDWQRASEVSAAKLSVFTHGFIEYLEHPTNVKIREALSRGDRNSLIPCTVCNIDGKQFGQFSQQYLNEWFPTEK